MDSTNSTDKTTSQNRSKESEKPPTTEHLAWMIKGRAATQLTTLKLYELFDTYPDRLKQFHFRAQDLVAVSFSLWRAVFLADRTGKMELKDAQAKTFMAKMLTDNAITFAQDRTAREFSFNYYLGNARYRLKRFVADWPSVEPYLLKTTATKAQARARWTALQQGFEEAVSCFAVELSAEPKPKPKPKRS